MRVMEKSQRKIVDIFNGLPDKCVIDTNPLSVQYPNQLTLNMSLELVIKELTAAINTLADAYGLQRVEAIDPEEFMDGPNAPDGNGPATVVIKHDEVPGALRRRGRPAGSKNKKVERGHADPVLAAAGTEAVFAPFPSAPAEPVAPSPPAPVPPVPEVVISEMAPEVVKVSEPVTTSPAPVSATVDAPPTPIAVSFTTEPVTHDTIRIEARHLVARGEPRSFRCG